MRITAKTTDITVSEQLRVAIIPSYAESAHTGKYMQVSSLAGGVRSTDVLVQVWGK